jgi:2-methylcitrate dehydratase PrpD
LAEIATIAHPLTAELARQAVAYRAANLEDDVIRVAKHCLLDWCAVALAAIEEPVSILLRKEYEQSSRGDVTVLGSDRGFAAADAALVNGATSHALDYDDVHPLIGHPSVAILPAVLAVAEEIGASGVDTLKAFVAGYDAAAFVGSIVMPSHYDRGFHSTATVGTFGAAVGVGLLLGLDEDRMRVALGLAGTEAAGLKCMFGTMAKPFHAGRAAANGVTAARLAGAGFTANPDVIETEQGFARTQSAFGDSPARAVEFQTGRVKQTLFKYHAACYLTHSSIEAIRQIRSKTGLRPDDVAELDIHVPLGHLKVCNIPVPRTGLELKFSLAQLAAGAVAGIDTAAITTYSDATALDPSISALRRRVRIHGDRKAGMSAEVLVRTKSGALHEATVDTGVPEPDLARQEQNLRRKFHSLVDPVIGPEGAARLHEEIEAFDRAPKISGLTMHWKTAAA